LRAAAAAGAAVVYWVSPKMTWAFVENSTIATWTALGPTSSWRMKDDKNWESARQSLAWMLSLPSSRNAMSSVELQILFAICWADG